MTEAGLEVNVITTENTTKTNGVVLKQKLEPGTVLFSNPKQGLYIKANNGIISVTEIQGENSRKMDIKEFLRGNSIEAGSIFE